MERDAEPKRLLALGDTLPVQLRHRRPGIDGRVPSMPGRTDARVSAIPGEAAEITVEGLVQGVGFRDFTRRHAAALALGGWVMNRPDGRVQVWAEGPREAIEQLIHQLSRGPRLARVDRIAVAWRQPSGCGPAFAIRSPDQ